MFDISVQYVYSFQPILCYISETIKMAFQSTSNFLPCQIGSYFQIIHYRFLPFIQLQTFLMITFNFIHIHLTFNTLLDLLLKLLDLFDDITGSLDILYFDRDFFNKHFFFLQLRIYNVNILCDVEVNPYVDISPFFMFVDILNYSPMERH